MDITTRKQAIERSLTRYFTGKACPRGHIVERRVDNCGCAQCHNEYAERWGIAHPDKIAQKFKKWKSDVKARKAFLKTFQAITVDRDQISAAAKQSQDEEAANEA